MKQLSFILCLLLLWALPVQAQTYSPTPYADPQAPVQTQRSHGTLADFGNIHFVCRSDTSGDYASSGICTVARHDAHSAAMDLGLNLDDNTAREDPEGMVLYLHISSSGNVPRAMAVQIQLYRRYEEAVDKAAGNNDPAATPRQGKLVFYEETVTGAGVGDDLEGAMRGGVRAVLSSMFAKIQHEQEDAR